MAAKRIGLVLPVARLWAMSLAYRIYFKPGTSGFAPGLRNLVAYEARRLGHLFHRREQLIYLLAKLRRRLRPSR